MDDETGYQDINETIRQQFESGWLAGKPQPIEALIGDSNAPNFLATLEELVHIELEFRWKNRSPLKRVKLEEYLQRFDQLNQPEIVNRLVQQEVRLRTAIGETPVAEEYQNRFQNVTVDFPTVQVQQDTGRAVQAQEDTGREMPTIMPSASELPDNADDATVVGSEATVDDLVVVGDAVPGYDLLGELGRGGMGVVYQARDQNLKRTVALKMILSGAHASDEDMQRFQIEAEAVAKLQHPNIVQIYEVSEHEGRPYIALEFADGGSLGEKIAGKPQDEQESAQLIETLAGAMQLAHENDIIHRDLKPANILLTADGEPRITDFGLAKRMDEDSNQTKSGAVMGTPSYMAPEQAGGKSDTLGPATDTYALGAILYHMLTGRPPFQAATQLDTIMQVLTEEPVAPRKLNPVLTVDLETICLKCLEKDAHRRYESAAALGEDLRRFLAGEPILARPVTVVERSWKWAKRRPAVAGMISVIALALISLIAGGLWYNAQLQDSLVLAETRRVEAQRQTELAEASRTVAEKRELEAIEAKRQATRSEGEAKRLLANTRVGNGTRFLLERDTTGALEWYVRGQSVNQHDDRDNEIAMMRTWNTLNQTAKPVIEITTSALGLGPTTVPGPLAKHAFLDRETNHVLVRYENQNGKDLIRLWDMDAPTTEIALKRSEELAVEKYISGSFWIDWHPDRKEAAVSVWQPTLLGTLSGKSGNAIDVYDIKTGKRKERVETNSEVKNVVQYSPNGKYLFTWKYTGQGFLWDGTTGLPVEEPQQHEYPDLHLWAFTPEGTRMVALSNANSRVHGQIINLDEGKVISEFLRENAQFRTAATSPDGKWVALSGSTSIHLLDLESGLLREEILRITTDSIGFIKMGFSEDGKYLLGTKGKTVQVWEVATWKPLKTFTHPENVLHAVFGPYSGRLLTCCEDGRVRIWDLHTGQLAHAPLTHDGPVNWAEFSQDGRRVFTLSNYNAFRQRRATIRAWDLATSVPPSQAFRHQGVVVASHFHPDGSRLLTAGYDGRVLVWNTSSGKPELTIKLEDHIETAFFSTDGNAIVTKTINNPEIVRLWDSTSGEPISPAMVQKDDINEVDLSPDGKRLLLAGDGREIGVWDVPTGQKIATQTGVKALFSEANAVPFAQFVNNGKQFIFFFGSTFTLCDSETGKVLNRISLGVSAAVFSTTYPSLAASAKGDLVAAVIAAEGFSADRLRTVNLSSVVILDTNTGKKVGAFEPRGVVKQIAFSVDGSQIIVGCEDGNVHLWDIEKRTRSVPPLEHSGAVNSIALSRDGRLLATAIKTESGGGAAQVWDLHTGFPLTPPLVEPWQEMTHVEFSPDGKTIMAWQPGIVEVLLFPIAPPAEFTSQNILDVASALTSSRRDYVGDGSVQSDWRQVCSEWPELISPSQRDIAEWHGGEARRAQDSSNWEGMVFHFGPIVESEADWEAYRNRAHYSIRARNYDQAARDYQSSIDRGMHIGGDWWKAACVALLRNDENESKRICQLGLERLLSQKHTYFETDRIAHACILGPEWIESYQALAEETQIAAGQHTYQSPQPGSLFYHAAVLYRTEQFEQAKPLLESSILWSRRVDSRRNDEGYGDHDIKQILDSGQPRYVEWAVAWVFLAMCEERLGNSEMAKSLFDRVTKWRDTFSNDPSEENYLITWQFDRYLEEARVLLGVEKN